ncbi:hypothetical protein [Actinomadura sp. B10D3]|uniref:hypothetical protein n=1 Tax=Actinomadura sp. B10D3 TaxID=3153557 RepID=UPI00325D7C8A
MSKTATVMVPEEVGAFVDAGREGSARTICTAARPPFASRPSGQLAVRLEAVDGGARSASAVRLRWSAGTLAIVDYRWEFSALTGPFRPSRPTTSADGAMLEICVGPGKAYFPG